MCFLLNNLFWSSNNIFSNDIPEWIKSDFRNVEPLYITGKRIILSWCLTIFSLIILLIWILKVLWVTFDYYFGEHFFNNIHNNEMDNSGPDNFVNNLHIANNINNSKNNYCLGTHCISSFNKIIKTGKTSMAMA